MQDDFFKENIVLPEVRQAFTKDKGKVTRVEVLIGIKWGSKPEDVVEKLSLMGVKNIKCTDKFVSAELTESQVNKIAEEKEVFKIWQNRQIRPMVAQSWQTIKASASQQLFHRLPLLFLYK